jgi:putative ABC transport system permease protein
MPSAVVQVFRLALADLRRDWALSLCQIFALAAVLTPLLVLAGLRQGVLGQMMNDLRQNPEMREIGTRVTGTNRFTQSWIEATGKRPDVAFIVGDARFTAASVTANLDSAPDAPPLVGTLVPTGPGDPVRGSLVQWAAGNETIVLSLLAARQLGAQTGSHLVLHVPRHGNGVDEGRDLKVNVAAVLPADRMAERRVILAAAPLVLGIQRFRDGYALPALGWPGLALPAGPPYYERLRMYARTINDVGALAAWLQSNGIEPVSRIEDIAPVQALDHGLSVVLLIIAVFAAIGLIVAVAATQWNGVQRKRRELALLALIGYGKSFLVTMALLEALMLGAGGVVMSLLLFSGAALSIDQVFAGVQRLSAPACRLGFADMAIASLLTVALTLTASALAAWQVARIEPAGMLREV